VQVLVVRDPVARPVNLVRVARHAERAVIALAAGAVVLWVVAHLVQVMFAVGLIAYVAKLAGRLVRF
jgi:hypothetical protein